MSQYKFELESDLLGKQEIIEPVGWDESKPTLTRDETYSGIIRSFTVGLTFVKNGYDYVRELKDAEGVLAKCSVYIYEYNNSTHEYELQDIGTLDFTSYKESDKYGKGADITITDTQFAEKIRGREDVEVNYNNNVDLDDNPMSEPIYVEQEVLGVNVTAKATVSTIDEYVDFSVFNGQERGSFWTPTANYEGQIEGGQSVTGRYINEVTGFRTSKDAFLISQEDDTDIIIDGSLFFTMYIENANAAGGNCYVSLRKSNPDNTSIILVEWVEYSEGLYENIELDISGTYNLNEGDYLYLLVRCGNESASFNNSEFEMFESTIQLTNKDQAAPTISKGAFIYDCFNRTIESITGVANTVQSNIFDDGGIHHDYTTQNGFLLRNYTEEESGMSWKFKDYFQGIEKIFNIGLGINNDNTVTIRDKKDFFQNGVIFTVTPDLLQADSFEKSIDDVYYFSDVEIGYAKSAYEEISGLEEYNNKSYYNTILSNLNNKLDGISKIRGDIYGIEFARRKQKDSDTTEDTKYDSDLFLFNIYNDAGNWIQLTDQGFSDISGIDQIETPGNLKITPGRNLRRWGWLLSAGLQKYADSKVKFNKSDVISDLSTTLNGDTVTENQDINYSELDEPLFTGEKIMFTAKLSFTNYKLIKENPYKLIKVWNPIDREYNFGWIREVGIESADKSTNWELIEAKSAIEVLSYWLTNDGFKWLWNDNGGILLNEQS